MNGNSIVSSENGGGGKNQLELPVLADTYNNTSSVLVGLNGSNGCNLTDPRNSSVSSFASSRRCSARLLNVNLRETLRKLRKQEHKGWTIEY